MKVGPKYKICRRLGESVFSKCQTPKFQLSKGRKMGGRTRRRTRTEYGLQLTEKQKVRYTYGVSERQLSNYVNKARTEKGDTSQTLFRYFESRLDNVVFRLGLASTRAFARQMVNHGHMTVNGKRVTIPSYSVRVDDIVSVREESKAKPLFAGIDERLAEHKPPSWLTLSTATLSGNVVGVPQLGASDVDLEFGQLIEFYSRV